MFVLAALVDFAVRATDRGLRVMLSATLVAGIVAVCWRLLAWWRRQRWSESAAAQALQKMFPQLGDRLASALEFLRQDEDDLTAGSAPLRRAVVAEVNAALDELPAEQVAERPSVSRAVVAAMAAIGVAVVLSVLAPHAARTAVARLAAPWNNVEWPRRHDLAFVDAPELIGRGDPFEASLVDTLGNLPDEVTIEYRYEVDGKKRIEQTWMQRVGNSMVARRENVRWPFAYRATGGDHNTMPWRQVKVVERPTASDVVLTIVPPAYSGLPIVTATSDTRVLSGSMIEVSATSSQPLATAQLLLADDESLAMATNKTSITTQSGQWQPVSESFNKILSPRMRLVAESGLESIINLPRVEVVADTPPQLTWESPREDLFVVAGARVPVAVAAADDLAIAGARLTVSTSDVPAEDAPTVLDIELYSGEAAPPSRNVVPQPGELFDERQFAYELEVATLEPTAGATIELLAQATDYRPQTGTADAPRRLTIITTAELDSRLAADQAEILRLLEQALADQRATREVSSRTATTFGDNLAASREGLDQLVAARLTQQGVRRTLLGEKRGVVDFSRAMLDRIAINQVEHPELVAQLERIRDTINALGSGSLPLAEQLFTDLRKAFEFRLGSEVDAQQAQQFAALEDLQQKIITTLESLIDEAGAWSDSDRFVRELARLEQEQRELRDEALAAARQNILAESDRKVQPIDEEDRQRMASAQADLARRFDKLAQSMREMAGSDTATSEFAARLTDALAAAESMSLSAQLAAASRELGDDQLGRAADTQQLAAEALSDLVERLRERAPTDSGELASRLRELQQQLADLKQQAADAERNADAGLQQQQQRRELEKQLASAARQLARLSAPAASQSAQSASSNAAPKPDESQPQAKERLQQTQRDIEQAERELAQRIAELESEQQQRLLDRLAQVLEDLIPQQQDTLEGTLQLELLRETPDALDDGGQARANDLSATERQIADELSEAIADVERRAVFQLALGGAADDMRQAARGLEQLQLGRVTQNLELNALSRMRHVLDILRDPPPPPPEGDPPASEGGEGAGGAPQRPPLIELAEVKMLRWLQLDLNTRTRLWEADFSDDASVAAEKREAARRLAAEQRRLEELVREMMRRNNDNTQPPVDL